MLSTRLKLRLAGHLQRSWPRKLPPDPDSRDWKHLESYLDRLKENHKRWELVKRQKLTLILPSVIFDVRNALDNLTRHIGRLCVPLNDFLTDSPDLFPFTNLRHWLAELQQLEDEFDDLAVDWKSKTIKVSTDFITLKDVPLGRFSIVFGWNRVGSIAGSRCFDLIALDPNPARNKDRVTHPHVQDEELCAGDSSRPLENAINEGRLADAFLLIRSVLTTYNPGSPYAPLDEWEGRSCGECGDSVDPDESRSCETCLADLCESCVSSCSQCSDSRCPSCLSSCESCHDSCCPGCLETIGRKSLCSSCIGQCADCQSRFPKEDLSADSLCPDCLESQESTYDTDLDSLNSAEPIPAHETIPLETPV